MKIFNIYIYEGNDFEIDNIDTDMFYFKPDNFRYHAFNNKDNFKNRYQNNLAYDSFKIFKLDISADNFVCS